MPGDGGRIVFGLEDRVRTALPVETLAEPEARHPVGHRQAGCRPATKSPKAREALAALLIDPPGLAVGRMPHLEQHARIRRLVRGGNVEVRRDVESGLTFVYDLLQAIPRAVEGANRPGV
jgi:hypothetical protein